MKISSLLSQAVTFLALALPLACGAGQPPAESASDTDDRTPSERRSTGNMSASAEIGALDQVAVNRTFASALGGLERCLREGAERVELLGGAIAFYVEIDTSGRAIHAHAEESTLGDRGTERCMIGVLEASTWPPPQGGDKGLARSSFDFDMPNDVRPPVDWESSAIGDALGGIDEQVRSCKQGVSGELTATVYVDTDGRVLAAGIASSDAAAARSADCLAEALKAALFPSPGSWPAKVSFRL
jgi:hypothetical protein